MSVVQLRKALLLAPAQLETIRDDFVRQARFLPPKRSLPYSVPITCSCLLSSSRHWTGSCSLLRVATTLHTASGRFEAHTFLSDHLSAKQALTGLNGDKSSLLMIPSMVDVLPTGCAAGAPGLLQLVCIGSNAVDQAIHF